MKIDLIGSLILAVFFLSLTYAGYLSYRSIDWTVLDRLEQTKLILPTPAIASPSALPASPSATTPTPIKK